jgi:tRNA pseudouridine-54 N-methylase
MKHFLVLFEDIPIDKTSVKSGDNSQEVITAARCVNVGLFISGDLRRDVVVSLVTGKPEDSIIISFPGADLKRVSPDERSISFFLLKAFAEADLQGTNSVNTMDNGIVVRRGKLIDFIESCSPEKIYLANSEGVPIVRENFEKVNSIFIYSITEPLNLELKGNKWDIRQIHRPSHPERFILDVNMVSDREINRA